MSSRHPVDPGSDANNRKKKPAETPAARPDPASADKYGKEGTNKTIAQPKPDNAPSEELGNTPHVEKTPYTRG
jgi:hypothetical protein